MNPNEEQEQLPVQDPIEMLRDYLTDLVINLDLVKRIDVRVCLDAGKVAPYNRVQLFSIDGVPHIKYQVSMNGSILYEPEENNRFHLTSLPTEYKAEFIDEGETD